MTPTLQSLPGRRLALALVLVADLLLLLLLLLTRITRVTDTDTPFITLEFVLLLAAALIAAVVSLWLANTRRFDAALLRLAAVQRWLLLIGAAVVGLGVLFGGAVLADALRPYLAPFLLWALVCLAALAVLLLTGQGSSGAAPLVRTLRRGLFILTLSTLLPVLLLELGVRFYFRTFGTETERVAYVYSWNEINALTSRFRAVPYLNYGLSPNYPGHNSFGFRGAEFSIARTEGTFRIVAMGGSTTYGFLIDDWQQAYPPQLETILRDTYGYSSVEVINAGVPAYATWETLAAFEYRVLDLQPDLIIVYDGINDLGARAIPPEDYAGIPGSAGTWQAQGPDLGPSALYRYIAINLGWMGDPNELEYRFLPFDPTLVCCDQYSDEAIAAHFAANPPIYFERNLRNLVAIADAHGVQVVFSSWTYYPEATTGSFNLMALDYRQQAIAEQNEVLRSLGADTSAAFYDLHADYPLDRALWFDDGIHMTPAGTRVQAELYATFLVESGLLPE